MNAKLARQLSDSNFRFIKNITAKRAIKKIKNPLIVWALETVKRYANKGFYGCPYYIQLCDEYQEELRILGYEVHDYTDEWQDYTFIYWGNANER